MRGGGHTQFDKLIVCGIINQCLLNDKFPHVHSQCRVNASESTGVIEFTFIYSPSSNDLVIAGRYLSTERWTL